MKIRQLKEMSPEELRAKQAELEEQLFKLRFQKSLGQLDSPMKIKNIKKAIARIKTILHGFEKATE